MNFQERYEDYLIHYGVPGMRWGHRKSQAKGYSDKAVKRDRAMYGDRRVRKINSKMLKGASYMQARHEVGAREYRKGDRLNKAGRILIPASVAASIAANITAGRLINKHNKAAKKYNDLIRMGGRDASGGAIKKRFSRIRNTARGAELVSALTAIVGPAAGASLVRAGAKRKNKYKSYQ